MTVIRLVGGLGNQLFQLAGALTVREQEGFKVTLDASWFNGDQGVDTPRVLEMAELSTGVPIRHFPKSITKLAYSRHNPRLLKESGDDDVLMSGAVSRRSWLQGYFQFAKYPMALDNILAPMIRRRLLMAPRIASRNDLAVHVRLGDYYHNPRTREHHGVLTPEYFARCIELMGTDRWSRIVVFTDSEDVFRAEFAHAFPKNWVLAPSRNAWDTIGAMASCGGVIMSNSSLSWWGSFMSARLGDGYLPRTIAPRPWFRNHSSADSRLLVPSWDVVDR
ncbi:MULTISPECIES: alpha-1,2-fucosyltransferase [unclassified Nocardioides]|uniref:alpha-1,2-fucosyltransferase n=1 Tax=unclassified Nocardioides TaxID=2615069 RepID=UPI0009F1040D|nr:MULTISPECIES: alpha-1,2-fucosyltransferase [unclassified Nocardioides]GAW51912.1 Glycosyl transferase family 11 [Nocardioides sp. PD653-B2]GAW57610.1 Glycosyl transferase family 11 [Nocardioides sp. PD653]